MGRKIKNKRDRMEIEGVVAESHKGCLFDVVLEDDNSSKVLANISGRMRKAFIKVVPGDKVKVELSPYDTSKGRIVQRMK
jgi:translation initiation factor IF-1